MNTIFLFVVIWVAIWAYCWRRWLREAKGVAIAALLACALIVGPVLGVVGADSVGQAVSSPRDCTHPYTLASIRTAETLTGSFILGCGEINGHIVYRCYIKNSDGGMQPFTFWDTKRVVIYEEDDLNGEGRLIAHVDNNLVDEDSRFAGWAIAPTYRTPTFSSCDWYELHVPRGSISHEFRLN
jgi:hypothetical protein